MPWGNEACEPQLLGLRSRAHQLQLLKAAYLELLLCSQRSQSNEKSAHGSEE